MFCLCACLCVFVVNGPLLLCRFSFLYSWPLFRCLFLFFVARTNHERKQNFRTKLWTDACHMFGQEDVTGSNLSSASIDDHSLWTGADECACLSIVIVVQQMESTPTRQEHLSFRKRRKWNVADHLDRETIRSNVLICLKFGIESIDQQNKSADMRTSISDNRRTQQSGGRCPLLYSVTEYMNVIAPFETETANRANALPLQWGSAYSESVTSKKSLCDCERLFTKTFSKYFEIFVGLFTIHNFNLTSGTTLYCLRKPILFVFEPGFRRQWSLMITTTFDSEGKTSRSSRGLLLSVRCSLSNADYSIKLSRSSIFSQQILPSEQCV